MEKILVLVRAACMFVGSLFLGHVFFGQTVDNVFIDVAAGVVLSGGALFWSIKEKTVSEDKIEGAVRQITTFGVGLLVSSGLLKSEQGAQLTAFSIASIPVISSYIMRWKNKKIASNIIDKHELKK